MLEDIVMLTSGNIKFKNYSQYANNLTDMTARRLNYCTTQTIFIYQ